MVVVAEAESLVAYYRSDRDRGYFSDVRARLLRAADSVRAACTHTPPTPAASPTERDLTDALVRVWAELPSRESRDVVVAARARILALAERAERAERALVDREAKIERRLVALYRTERHAVAFVCDEALDRSGALLGRIRERADNAD
jgi:hypothetical protein